MASRQYRLAAPSIRSTPSDRKIVVHYRPTLSRPSSNQGRPIMTNDYDTSNRKTLLDDTKVVETTPDHVPPARWWFVLPCLVLIALASSATSLLLNDLLVYRYEIVYGIQGSTQYQQNACRESSRSQPIIYYWLPLQFIPQASPRQSQQNADYNLVQMAVAQFNVKNSLVTFFPSLISFMLLGANCDTIGRQPMLLLPFLGKMVDMALMLVVVTRNLSDAWILVAHALEALFGSAGLLMLSAFAFITDCTLESNRTRAFLITELVLVIVRVGPSLGLGFWLRQYPHSYVAPIIVSLVLSTIGLLYVLLIQPESVQSV